MNTVEKNIIKLIYDYLTAYLSLKKPNNEIKNISFITTYVSLIFFPVFQIMRIAI